MIPLIHPPPDNLVLVFGFSSGLALTYLIFDVDITAEINEMLHDLDVIFHHTVDDGMMQRRSSILK